MNTKSIIGLVILFLLTCCSSSRITHSWKSETANSGSYDKIMVIGIIKDHDRNLREQMENHLADDLKARGYNAVSSLKEYGPKAFDNMDEEGAITKLSNSGVDAVITIVLLDKERERNYVPARVHYSPYIIYQRHFWGYYSTIYDRIYSPEYFQQVNTKYFWESNFYDLKTKQLLYSVQTESFDPASAESLGHEYGEMIVMDMFEKKIINHQPKLKS